MALRRRIVSFTWKQSLSTLALVASALALGVLALPQQRLTSPAERDMESNTPWSRPLLIAQERQPSELPHLCNLIANAIKRARSALERETGVELGSITAGTQSAAGTAGPESLNYSVQLAAFDQSDLCAIAFEVHHERGRNPQLVQMIDYGARMSERFTALLLIELCRIMNTDGAELKLEPYPDELQPFGIVPIVPLRSR